MAGDLRDLAVGKRHIDAAVAGGDDKIERVEGKPRLFDGFVHDPERQMAVLRARRPDVRGQDFFLFVRDDHFRHRGPDVHSGKRHNSPSV